METKQEYTHFCDDQKNQYFAILSLTVKLSRKFEVPYETVYLFDSVQIKNKIYFTGGGLPPTGGKGEQFFQRAVCLTIAPDMDSTKEDLPNMNVSRANHTIAALTPTLLYVVGGCNTKAEIPSCEEYSIDKKKWREVAYLNEKKMWVSVCTFNSRYLYAFGGSTNLKPKESELIESLDTTDPAAKYWTKVVLKEGKELWKRSFFAGCMQISPDLIIIFGGLVNKAEVNTSLFFNAKTSKMIKGPDLLKADAFYRTKPGLSGNELMVVGSCEGDLHTFKIAEKKWEIIKKDTWNPEIGFAIHAGTF
jgi:hypothetical protein